VPRFAYMFDHLLSHCVVQNKTKLPANWLLCYTGFMKNSWKDYYEKKKGCPPSQLMLEGLQYVEEKKSALDIGPGGLIDSQHLVDNDFKIVISIDSEVAVAEAATRIESDNFLFIPTTFEEYQYPEDYFDYINAQFALHFIHPDNFKEVFSKIVSSLKNNGVFAGTLVGDRDSWNNSTRSITCLTKDAVESLLGDLEIIVLKEIEHDKPTIAGTKKHWHQFNFIVSK